MNNTDPQRVTSSSFLSRQPLSVSVPSLRALMANRLHQRDHSASQVYSQLLSAQTRPSFQPATSFSSLVAAAPLSALASPATPLSVASGSSPDRANTFASHSRHFGRTDLVTRDDSSSSSRHRYQNTHSTGSMQAASASSTPASSSTPLRRSIRLARTDEAEVAEVEVPSTDRSRKRSRVKSPKKSTPRKRQKSLKEPPLSSPPSEDDLDKKPSAVANTCTICLCEPDKLEVSSLDGCSHLFCFSCIEKWSERENTCPLCKCRFSRITRINPQRGRKGSASARNTKKVKTRDQRADMPTGAAIEGLLASLASGATFPGSSRLSRMFAAQVTVPIVRARRMNTEPSVARMGVTMLHPSMNLEDDDDSSLIGFMQAVLRSHREGHHGDMPGELHVFSSRGPFSGFGRPLPTSSSASVMMTSRSHASNENDSSAGRAQDNPLEIDDSEDEVEFVHIS